MKAAIPKFVDKPWSCLNTRHSLLLLIVSGCFASVAKEDHAAKVLTPGAVISACKRAQAFHFMKGIATSDEANPRKRKLRIPKFFKCGEKSLKTSSGEGRRQEMYKRRVPPRTDSSSPKGNTENTASSASLVRDCAPLAPLRQSRFSHESSSSSPKPTSCTSFPRHLFADPSRAAGAGKGNSRLDNSSTGENVSGFTVVKKGRFTVTSWLSCFQPSTSGGDNDRNRRPDSSSTNVPSANAAAGGASDRNTMLNNTSPDLSSADAGDDTDRDRRPDSSSSSSNKEVGGAPKEPQK